MSKAEKYVKDFTNHCSNDLMFGGCAPWISPENALDAAKIAQEEIIKEACAYIRTQTLYDGLGKKTHCVDLEEFKKEMKRRIRI